MLFRAIGGIRHHRQLRRLVTGLGLGLLAVAAISERVPSAAQSDRIADACGGPNPYFAISLFLHEEMDGGRPAIPTARPTARPTMRPGRPNEARAPEVAGQALDRADHPSALAYPGPSDPAILAFHDTANDSAAERLKLATQGQVGTVYGLAYDWRRGQVYAGAYHKRMTSFGSGGPGGIYQVDVNGGGVRRWAQLAAGANTHAFTADNDAGAAAWVGKVGLGDLEISEDGSELWAVNLFDRRIYRLQVPSGTILGSFAHGAAAEPWAANARPFGLGTRGDWLYHGVVDSRQDAALPGSLVAAVYRSQPDGSQMSEVLRLDLGYRREAPGGTPQLPWVPWDDTPVEGRKLDGQAMLADIEFRPSGEPILGFRDRQGDMATFGIGFGDILPTRAQADGAGHLWVAVTQPERYDDELKHFESSWGGLAAFPGLDAVISNALAPLAFNTGGAVWFDNASGQIRGPNDGKETLYLPSLLGTFAKASGLGDVEALCVLAPRPTATALQTTATSTASETATASQTPSATATRLPTDTPTATQGPPTPTPTASPSPTAVPTRTSTASPTASASPTRRPSRRIYLPLAERSCAKLRPPVDVALVIDMSTSMLRPARDGRPKLEAALAAASRFGELLSLRSGRPGSAAPARDRVAIAGFNASAWVETPLTDDRGVVNAALARLPARIAEYTRLDLALGIGRDALLPVSPSRSAVLILLTDGLPNRVPPAEDGSVETTILRMAQTAKRAGIGIWTVGLGEPSDINAALLEGIASRPANYRYAPDASALADIYGQIARGLGCE